MPALILFLICDMEATGDNADLFVNAADKADAVQAWRDYYELDEDTTPERVIIVPTPTEPGAVNWDSITQFQEA